LFDVVVNVGCCCFIVVKFFYMCQFLLMGVIFVVFIRCLWFLLIRPGVIDLLSRGGSRFMRDQAPLARRRPRLSTITRISSRPRNRENTPLHPRGRPAISIQRSRRRAHVTARGRQPRDPDGRRRDGVGGMDEDRQTVRGSTSQWWASRSSGPGIDSNAAAIVPPTSGVRALALVGAALPDVVEARKNAAPGEPFSTTPRAHSAISGPGANTRRR